MRRIGCGSALVGSGAAGGIPGAGGAVVVGLMTTTVITLNAA